jgi:hypothetical protein
MRVLLDVLGDEEANIWIDAASPLEVLTESGSPHRGAVGTNFVDAGPNQKVHRRLWLRFERSQAYQLIDLFSEQLEGAIAKSSEGVTKSTKLKGPIKGGVNQENGNMVLVFEGLSGLKHRMELPFDQSGATMEILESAAKTAAEWNDTQPNQTMGLLQRVNIQPREAESMMLGEDPTSCRPILIVRLVGGLQFSSLLDRKIVEELRKRPMPNPDGSIATTGSYATVAEDLEWLQSEWCVLYEPPSNADLRRGSAALRRLLVDNTIQTAWLHHGFKGQPKVAGPDMGALAADQGFQLKHAISLIAGGGCLNGTEARDDRRCSSLQSHDREGTGRR